MQAKRGAVVVARRPGQGQKQAAGEEEQDRSRMSRDIVKVVLASPLTIPWPNLPKHLQDAAARSLPFLLPPEVADYHVSRQRCQQRDKKVRRKEERAEKRAADSAGESANGPETPLDPSHAPAGDSEEEGKQTGAKRKAVDDGNAPASAARPSPPAILDHLVLGINETIKALEKQITDIKMEMMVMADHLNSRTSKCANPQSTTNVSLPDQRFLPTAPDLSEPAKSTEATPSITPPATAPANGTRRRRPLEASRPEPIAWILIPLPQINPPALVGPIPQYCATYNSLVYQHAHLRKVFRTRTSEKEWNIAGDEKSEVRVVPLGRVEEDMAGHAGLRRLACLGIRASHPANPKLDELLPKSILHPPRHSVTVPFPVSSLKVHSSGRDKHKKAAPEGHHVSQDLQESGPLPLPHVHYAPLHVKGITTTVPADSGARKARRLAEVRERRLKIKEKKKEERAKMIREALGQNDKRERKKGHEHGRKAAKAAKRQTTATASAGASASTVDRT